MKNEPGAMTSFFTCVLIFLIFPECSHSFHLSCRTKQSNIISSTSFIVNSSRWKQQTKQFDVKSSFSKISSQRDANNNIEDEKKKNKGDDAPEEKLDSLLSNNELGKVIAEFKRNPDLQLTRDRLTKIFDVIEYRTSQLDESTTTDKTNTNTNSSPRLMSYPPTSKARMEMTEMYRLLQSKGILTLFGAISSTATPTGIVLPASGSKVVTPQTLERITQMKMTSLTPKTGASNTLLIAGALLALAEGLVSYYTGVDYSFLVGATLLTSFLDRLFLNGALYEQMLKLVWPEYSQQVIRHEAGHFLLSYLLGCPVEGCVLSSFAAMKDPRFATTSISAGTSFFDPDISEQVNNVKPLTRASIDRFSIIVMGGIAAEAICYGRADGGAGDEQTLVRFLGMISGPRSGATAATSTWDAELIRNQARWGAAQSVLLLKHYKPVYDALVDALERGYNLGECIYAIEKAARENELGPLSHPLGFITDTGLLSEWELYNPTIHDLQPPQVEGGINNVQQQARSKNIAVAGTDTSRGSSTTTTSEDFLKTYKTILEEKLKRLDDPESISIVNDRNDRQTTKNAINVSVDDTSSSSWDTASTVATSEEFPKTSRVILQEKLKKLEETQKS